VLKNTFSNCTACLKTRFINLPGQVQGTGNTGGYKVRGGKGYERYRWCMWVRVCVGRGGKIKEKVNMNKLVEYIE